MATNKRDYYQVLGVDRNADEQTLKRAFRALAMQYHPDRNKAPDADAKFKEINEAYDVLTDPKRRAIYDQYGHDGLRQGGAGPSPQQGNFEDIFSQMFSGGDTPFADIFGGGQQVRSGPRKGRDVLRTVPISFRQWVTGTEAKLNVQVTKQCASCHGSGANSPSDIVTCQTCRGHGVVTEVRRTVFGNMQSQTACPTCHGTGKRILKPCAICRGQGHVQANETVTVAIPSGIGKDEHVVLRGYGGPGTKGGPPGDMGVAAEVAPSRHLRRSNDDVVMELPVDPFKALAGGRVTVPTFSGIKELVLPRGSIDGQRFTIPNEGFATGRKVLNRKGDLIVVLKFTPTRSVTADEQAFLDKMAALTNPTVDARLADLTKEVV